MAVLRKEDFNAYPGTTPRTRRVEYFAHGTERVATVSYIHGPHVGVTVRNHTGAATTVDGEDHLRAARDGLIDACKHFGIE